MAKEKDEDVQRLDAFLISKYSDVEFGDGAAERIISSKSVFDSYFDCWAETPDPLPEGLTIEQCIGDTVKATVELARFHYNDRDYRAYLIAISKGRDRSDEKYGYTLCKVFRSDSHPDEESILPIMIGYPKDDLRKIGYPELISEILGNLIF